MNSLNLRLFILSLLAIAAASTTASLSAQDKDGTFNLLVENDVLAGVDKHYTSGLQISYLSSPNALPKKFRTALSIIPGIDDNERMRAGIQLGHSIFTPNDIETSELLKDERPYAAWAYAGFAVVSENDVAVDTWMLSVGKVGPAAKGQTIQNNFHDRIGAPEALGWENQIEDTNAASVVYEHRWRNLWQTDRARFGVDINPHLGFSVGNLTNYVNGGVTLRIGNDLRNGFAPPRIRPSLPGSSYFSPRDDFAWYLFAGVDYRRVESNLLLEGETPFGRNNIDAEKYVRDAQAGFVVSFSKTRFTFSFVRRSKEFRQQMEPDEFGSVSISYKL